MKVTSFEISKKLETLVLNNPLVPVIFCNYQWVMWLEKPTLFSDVVAEQMDVGSFDKESIRGETYWNAYDLESLLSVIPHFKFNNNDGYEDVSLYTKKGDAPLTIVYREPDESLTDMAARLVLLIFE